MLCMLMMNLSIIVSSQVLNEENIIIDKDIKDESTIILNSVTNKSDYDIYITITLPNDSPDVTLIPKGEIIRFTASECTHIQVATTDASYDNTLWTIQKTKKIWKEREKSKQASNVQKSTSSEKNESADKVKKEIKPSSPNKPTNKKKVKKSHKEIIKLVANDLESDRYWSIETIEEDTSAINKHIKNINENYGKAYIANENLSAYVQNEGKKIEETKANIESIASIFLSKYKNQYKIDKEADCQDSIINILKLRLSIREKSIEALKSTIDVTINKKSFDLAALDKTLLIEIGTLALAAVILFVWFGILAKRKKNKQKKAETPQAPVNDSSPVIVVRKKTTSVLKKQSLESVINDKAYLKIECVDFCDDSAVKHMYIKNTCIKDIYNMYADDLRNPNNPKEDGCMVLGRWIHDEQTKEYCVSLEEIVRPGDDAVFQEYELNFGGKIKLRVAERLRKLRNETNLQYDLTCWVHSHPGLGVFFSNSDTTVQTQLKHPTHPNFLTAIVIDILTPQQEFGIFTFKHDSSINSRNDLKKMYSLEELHKWAIESDRNSYKAEDYYNVLSKAENVDDNCQGIQLSNGAIIDVSSFATEQGTGLVGWAHGFKTQSREKNEFVVNSVTKASNIPDNEQLGCLIIGTLCSIPSIRKAIAECADKIKFVMFYSNKDETITTIPVKDAQLSMDEKYYSEEKLEDLKIWTRRKR